MLSGRSLKLKLNRGVINIGSLNAGNIPNPGGTGSCNSNTVSPISR